MRNASPRSGASRTDPQITPIYADSRRRARRRRTAGGRPAGATREATVHESFVIIGSREQLPHASRQPPLAALEARDVRLLRPSLALTENPREFV